MGAHLQTTPNGDGNLTHRENVIKSRIARALGRRETAATDATLAARNRAMFSSSERLSATVVMAKANTCHFKKIWLFSEFRVPNVKSESSQVFKKKKKMFVVVANCMALLPHK